MEWHCGKRLEIGDKKCTNISRTEQIVRSVVTNIV